MRIQHSYFSPFDIVVPSLKPLSHVHNSRPHSHDHLCRPIIVDTVNAKNGMTRMDKV